MINPYIKRFIDSFTSECVIALFNRYKNASKEITESWGCFQAALDNIENVSSHKVIVIGDGASPRTGSIFSYFSKADVVSVDPAINIDHWNEHKERQHRIGNPIQRLEVIKDKVENVIFNCDNIGVIVVWPHSHANMNNIQMINHGTVHHIAMPCCVKIPPSFANVKHIAYVDENVLSPHNKIYIWKNYEHAK